MLDLKVGNTKRAFYWWSAVRDAYCQNWRYYTNLKHLALMQETFGVFREMIPNPNVFRLALWFHHYAFVPRVTGVKNINSVRSIQALEKFIEEVEPELTSEEVELVKKLITVTDGHRYTEENFNSLPP